MLAGSSRRSYQEAWSVPSAGGWGQGGAPFCPLFCGGGFRGGGGAARCGPPEAGGLAPGLASVSRGGESYVACRELPRGQVAPAAWGHVGGIPTGFVMVPHREHGIGVRGTYSDNRELPVAEGMARIVGLAVLLAVVEYVACGGE